MIGLSLTAVGLRPLGECLDIYDELRQPLSLDYLELAIGVVCPVDAAYGNTPLVLHDSCLWDDAGRRRLDPLSPRTWRAYASFVDAHDVRAVSVHAPARRRCSATELDHALVDLEAALGVAVLLEVMPDPQRWCSSADTLIERPLLLDVSHVLIWSTGDAAAAECTSHRVLGDHAVGGLHLSHNDGTDDSHELIPTDSWFSPHVERWAADRFVTYESLPAEHAKYERLDHVRSRWRRRRRDNGSPRNSPPAESSVQRR